MSAQEERRAVLVTGGAGYIGSHVCKALDGAGFLPVTYDNLSCGHSRAVRWGPLEEGDVLDGKRLLGVLERYRPLAVVHLAASAYVDESVRDPLKYYRNNVAGTVSLLGAMRKAGIDKMVFSSSCTVYGLPGEVPIPETHPTNPISPYGMTKVIVERMLADAGRAYPMRHVSLRYFNAAGADPDLETGELHDPETHLIPLVLMAALGIKDRITVFGQDHPTPDGTCVRDYIHVSDLARAHIMALARLMAGEESATFNLGTGKGYSVRQVIDEARRVTGRDFPVAGGEKRPGDPPILVAHAEKARQVLGWEPELSDLGTIIETAWGWAKNALAPPE